MRSLAQSVQAYIRKHRLLRAGDRVGAAVSSGADSVALLRVLLELRRELGIVLSVVHFNHKLRKEESEADERFVAELALQHKLVLRSAHGDVGRYAAEKRLSLETAARELRYEFFFRLLREGAVNRLATGHTLDDQAETILLRITRGAGTRGLAGIYPQISVPGSGADGPQLSAFGSQEDLAIVRPLLGTRHSDLEAYLRAIGQDWREDASNQDLRHARNRVRHEILPSLERNLNPAVRELLAETAEIAREEEEYWQEQVKRVLPEIASAEGDQSAKDLDFAGLRLLPLALQRRVVRATAESVGLRLEFHHVEEILALAHGGAKSAELPNGWTVSRGQRFLRFEPTRATDERDYEYTLRIPGTVEIAELGTRLDALLVPVGGKEGYNPDNLLNPAFLGNELRVRNWRAGDRFWPAHSKRPKKIKELLQDRHISGTDRRLWPVVVSASEVVWMRGFAVPRRLLTDDENGEAVVIRESKE